jgi:LacI family transcriptional regulator
MQVTIVDIAKRLSLSHTTVSRVLNSRTDRFISESTRAKVLAAARQMGYRPNLAARALVTGRTNRIAFWSPGTGERYFQEMAFRFHRLLRKHNYQLFMGEVGPGNGDSPADWGFTRQDVDGVIMFTGGQGESLKPVLEQQLPGMAPAVVISPYYVGRLDFVGIDLYAASVAAMDRLLQSGRKRIAHVLTPYTRFEQDGRYRAYMEAVQNAGLSPALVVVPDGTKEASRRGIAAWIHEHGKPDAAFCANDEVAIGVYRGLCDLGLKVPADVALVGCDDIEEIRYLEVPLSTMSIDMDALGEKAWELLARRMENPDIPQQNVHVQATFIRRESC